MGGNDSEQSSESEAYADSTPLTHVFGNNPRVKVVSALLSEDYRWLAITDIATIAGLNEPITLQNLSELVELGLVEKDEQNGSEKYKIDGDSEAIRHIAKVEEELVLQWIEQD